MTSTPKRISFSASGIGFPRSRVRSSAMVGRRSTIRSAARCKMRARASACVEAQPGGGMSPDGSRWIACKPGFFLPVRVLSRLFRRLFLEGFAALCAAGRLALLSWEIPRLCRGGSRSLTFPAVCALAALCHEENRLSEARPVILRKGRFPAAMEQCREHDEVSDSGRIFREVVKGRQLGPFEGPQS